LRLFSKKIKFNADAQKSWNILCESHHSYTDINIDGISEGNSSFLLKFGLPDQTYNLNFVPDLRTVDKVYSVHEEPLNHFVRIGFDGSGDPITIYLKTNDIWILNHDTGFEPSFVNQNLEKLALSIIELDKFNAKLKKLSSESTFSTEYELKDFTLLKQNLSKIDPDILLKRGHENYWLMLLAEIEWNRNEERNTANTSNHCTTPKNQ
jgi:hypothetical protein